MLATEVQTPANSPVEASNEPQATTLQLPVLGLAGAPVVVPARAVETPSPRGGQPIGVMVIKPGVYQGTVKQFIDAGLKVNDRDMTVLDLSTLAKLGFFPVVGSVQMQRGKPSAVYLVDTVKNKSFTF